jgi:hypothetical protein
MVGKIFITRSGYDPQLGKHVKPGVNHLSFDLVHPQLTGPGLRNPGALLRGAAPRLAVNVPR